MENKKLSFTSASTFPVKVVKQASMVFDKEKRIMPCHIQLIITNKCNRMCSYCSCDNRDKRLEMSTQEAIDIGRQFYSLGSRAVTITGGGEPLLHPGINDIIVGLKDEGYSIGLVTNGIKMGVLSDLALRSLTWCRVSFDGDRDFQDILKHKDVYKRFFGVVDWAFSYVLNGSEDVNILKVVTFANENKFSHVRIVSNLISLDTTTCMDKIKSYIKKAGIDDGRVVYQGRKDYVVGVRECLISLLKPVITCDGNVYPCCGIQYAKNDGVKDFSGVDALCSIGEFKDFSVRQESYDGSKCVKCYYSEYNTILSLLKTDVSHEGFL